MKHISFCAVALCIMATPLATHSTVITNRSVATPGSTLANFVYMTPVAECDFRNTGETTLKKTFTISNPGHYVLVQDIGFAASSADQNAIYINSSNVTLDLGGRTLYNNGVGTTMTGVSINTGLKNITLKNGNIVGFSEYGIETADCRNLRIENLSIGECAYSGIYLGGTSTSADVSEAIINNCIISHCNRASGASTALSINFGYNIIISNTLVGRTITTTSGDVKGLYLANSRNVTVTNCDFGSNSSAGSAYGAYIENCRHVALSDCTSGVNNAASGNSGYGFYVTATSYDISFKTCTAHSNYGAGTGSGYGFYINGGYNTSFVDCTANSNYSSGTGHGYGFYLTTAYQSYFENCRASYNNAGATGACGCGFYQTSSDKTIYKNCTSVGNKAGSGASGITQGGHGFVTASGFSSLYQECVATGNVTDTSGTNSTSAGFFAYAETDTAWITCEARANGSDSITKNAAGFFLDDTTASCVRCILKGCSSFGHRTSGGTAYGFFDDASATSTLIIDCLAFGNETANYYLTEGTGSSNVSLNSSVTNKTIANITSRPPFQNATITSAV